ncbi:hypothetical protein BBJ28_00007537, partial [Nothophytophthora sp. Chile5]
MAERGGEAGERLRAREGHKTPRFAFQPPPREPEEEKRHDGHDDLHQELGRCAQVRVPHRAIMRAVGLRRRRALATYRSRSLRVPQARVTGPFPPAAWNDGEIDDLVARAQRKRRLSDLEPTTNVFVWLLLLRLCRVAGQQARGMATEKQIQQRIQATSNIAKITKSMKMVSAAKMRGAENRMNAGRPFTAWLDNVVGAKDRTIEEDGLAPVEELEGDNLFVVVSSDRGLCGGINSGIAKTARKQVLGIEDHSQIFVIGDKGRAQLRRDLGKLIRGNVTETFASPPNFTVASAIAEGVMATAKSDTEKVHVVY